MNIAIITGASSGMGREFATQLAPILTKTDEIWLLAKRKEPLDDLALELSKELELKKKKCKNSGNNNKTCVRAEKVSESQINLRIEKRRRHSRKNRTGRKCDPNGSLKRLRAHDIRIRTIAVDISNEKKLAHFAEVLMIRNPAISVLINCAGTGIYGAFDKLSREEVSQTVKLNVVGLTQLTKYCLPYMRRGSRIIQMASAAAFSSQADFAVYAASKAYVYSFSKALAKELKSREITVTVVCPGPVDTPFLNHAYGRYGKMNRLKKFTMAKPDKVVRKALADSKNKKRISIYGIPMKFAYLFAKA